MKLRTALKICRAVCDPCGNSSHTESERKRRWNRHCHVRWPLGQMMEAVKIGRRKTSDYPGDRRFPYIPSEREQHESDEMMGCLLLNMAEELGAPAELVDQKKREFLVAMDECRPE